MGHSNWVKGKKHRETSPPISIINNIYTGMPNKLSDDSYERIYLRVSENEELSNKNQKYIQPDVPDETIKLFKIQLAIENKIRELVLTNSGGWAGHSIAPVSTFLDIGTTDGLITSELLEEISSFYWELTPGIYGSPTSKDTIDRVEVIALDIMQQLNKKINEITKP